MSQVIVFNKTNLIGDDYEETTDEVARQFWASPEAIKWLANPNSWRLERLALGWVGEHFGNWDSRDDWEPIYEAIHAAMPRS